LDEIADPQNRVKITKKKKFKKSGQLFPVQKALSPIFINKII